LVIGKPLQDNRRRGGGNPLTPDPAFNGHNQARGKRAHRDTENNGRVAKSCFEKHKGKKRSALCGKSEKEI